MKEVMNINKESDISSACEWAENRLTACRVKVADARLCALIQEEILLRLMKAGLTELTVLIARQGSVHIEILARGPKTI